MTDNTIPAEKVQETIKYIASDIADFDPEDDWMNGYSRACENHRSLLEALLPTPPTLADELREYGDSLAGVSVGDLRRQLILFADRVETLEQERDEGNRAVDEVRDFAYTVSMKNKALKNELEDARLVVEKQTDEIVGLRARKLPDGWKVADHPEYGRVIVTKPTPDHEGDVHFVYPNHALVMGCDWHLCDAAELTFCDEAPAPQQEMDAR